MGTNSREYAQAHYLANREAYLARAKVANEVLRLAVKARLVEAKARPCADCGVQYPFYVMQFDHVRGVKEFDIGNASRGRLSMKRVDEEIAKCEVVCANCHASRTFGLRSSL